MKLGISEKKLLGWEPRQTHHYTYADNDRVASVVVEVEPEWDDVERTKMLALLDYEASICECGFPSAMTSDPSFEFAPEVSVCPICAGVAQQHRRLDAEDGDYRKRFGKNGPRPGEPMPGDGRHLHVRHMGKRTEI